jgi:putative hemolysin
MRQTGRRQVTDGRVCTALSVLLLSALLLAGPAAALKDPSAVYCSAMGYQYVVVKAPDGGETGQCLIPGTGQVDSWKFLQGEVAQDKSYCAQQGLQYRKVTDPEACRVFGLDTCMVCVLADGKAVEVTKYMNLSFEEGVCGDGTCAMSENTATCPKDCLSGGADGYCDGAKDGKCDPDCKAPGSDPDCGAAAAPTRSPAGPYAALVAAGGVALILKRARG